MATFYRWLFGSKTSDPERMPRLQLQGNGTYPLAVVSESHYQGAFELIVGARTENGIQMAITAQLVLEDTNPYDRNAVRVVVRGMTVGYLSRPDAKAYREYLRKAGTAMVVGVCEAQIRGGWDHGGDKRGRFGIWLDFTLYG